MNRRDFLTGTVAAAMLPLPAIAGTRSPNGYLRTNWSRDPWALGSYSYVAKGARHRDLARMAEPVGETLFFAGEAANPNSNSTVHAAHRSGLLAVEALQSSQATAIAVIGAGIAGLTVAKGLADAGQDVTVFEARDRIGGRTWTNTDLGAPLDLGASWIHGHDGNPVTELAQQANAKMVATGFDSIARGKGGAILSDRDQPDWIDDITEFQHGFGTEADTVNLSAYAFHTSYDGEERVFPKGYAAIYPALQGDYDVRLATAITQVAYDDASVTLKDAAGHSHKFDAVVVTVPLGVLKAGKIVFSPALPARKQTAIDRLQMGVLDKLYLRYDRVFWDRDATWIITPENDLKPGHLNQWLNFSKLFDLPILMAFNAGANARELAGQSDHALLEMARQTLELAYPR